MSIFYPRLFEEETQLDIPLDVLKKAVGKSSSHVTTDIVDDTVIKVDDKLRSDKLDWETVRKASGRWKKNITEFLKQRGYDVEENIKKPKRGQKLTHTQRLDVTYGDFWDHQVEKLRQEGYDVESSNKKASSAVEIEINKVFDKISPELLDFYETGGKLDEFKNWLSNIPPNSKIVWWINNFLGLLHRIVTNSSGSRLNLKEVIKNKSLETPFIDMDTQERWKKNMLDRLGAYTKPEDLNDTNVYTNEVLKHGEFLNALFMLEDQGVGRGEVLMTYLIPNARFPGGSESYDLLITNEATYEIKDYSNVEKSSKGTIDSIRLGKGGKLTRFDVWKKLEDAVYTAQRISKDLTKEELKELLDPYLYTLWHHFVSEDDYNNHPKAVASGVAAGEVSDERLRLIKLWFYLVHELIEREGITSKDEYTTAVLRGSRVPDRVISIYPKKTDDIEKAQSLEISSENRVKSAIRSLSVLAYVQQPDKFQEDLDDIPNEYFHQNNYIDYFLVFRPNKINIVGKDGFAFAKITQASIKIIEKEYTKDDNKAKRAYDKWKQSIDAISKDADSEEKESYQQLKKDISYRDFFTAEMIADSFYPRIRRWLID